MTVQVYRVWPVGQEVTTGQPGYGPTYGGQLVEVYGDGFPVSPDGIPRVRVRFGFADATAVRVVASNVVRMRTPPTPIPTMYDTSDSLVSDGTGLVDVEVQVLDADGAPVIGEVATLAGGYRYKREPVHDERMHVYAYYTASLLQQLRRDYIPNVDFSTRSVDYVAPAAKLPAMVLAGFSRTPSSRTVRGAEVVDGSLVRVAPLGGIVQVTEAEVYDLVYPVEVYIDEVGGGQVAILNLLTQLDVLVKQNPKLEVPCDISDYSQGIAVVNRLTWDPGDAGVLLPREAANDDGLYWFTGTLRVYGVELRGGTFAGTGVEDVLASFQELGSVVSAC